MVRKLFITLISVCCAIAGAVLTLKYGQPLMVDQSVVFMYGYVAMFALLFGIIGLLIAPHIVDAIRALLNASVNEFSNKSLSELIPGVIGLIIGLIVASLVSITVVRIAVIGPYLAVLLELMLGYLGFMVGFRKRDDFSMWAGSLRKDKEERYSKPERPERERSRDFGKKGVSVKILDTSVIIDGRIADIYRTGFVEGDLIIAGFVLEELQHIADSSDALKRNRGRSGLDCIKMMQNEFGSSIVIYNKNYPDTMEVDSKLLRLAKDTKGVVVTNDYNLNKVAQVRGVKVLNINDLANAVKPILLPGEDLTVSVVREGKEQNQGVAYLDDGTMIVVENGRQFVGNTIFVVVTSILQTSAGRMVFAKPKTIAHGDGCD